PSGGGSTPTSTTGATTPARPCGPCTRTSPTPAWTSPRSPRRRSRPPSRSRRARPSPPRSARPPSRRPGRAARPRPRPTRTRRGSRPRRSWRPAPGTRRAALRRRHRDVSRRSAAPGAAVPRTRRRAAPCGPSAARPSALPSAPSQPAHPAAARTRRATGRGTPRRPATLPLGRRSAPRPGGPPREEPRGHMGSGVDEGAVVLEGGGEDAADLVELSADLGDTDGAAGHAGRGEAEVDDQVAVRLRAEQHAVLVVGAERAEEQRLGARPLLDDAVRGVRPGEPEALGLQRLLQHGTHLLGRAGHHQL